MSDIDEDAARALFEHRIADLGLSGLTAHDRTRLWAAFLKQRRLSAGYDATVDPTTEPVLIFGPGGESK